MVIPEGQLYIANVRLAIRAVLIGGPESQQISPEQIHAHREPGKLTSCQESFAASVITH